MRTGPQIYTDSLKMDPNLMDYDVCDVIVEVFCFVNAKFAWIHNQNQHFAPLTQGRILPILWIF